MGRSRSARRVAPWKVSQVLQNFGLLIARVGTGGILLLHGITHWTGANQGVAAMRDRYAEVGAPYADVAAWATIIFELVGGDLPDRRRADPVRRAPARRAVGAEHLLLLSYYAGPDLLQPDGTYNGGYEYDVALGLLGLLFFVFGAGAISIDRLFKRKKPVDRRGGHATLPTRCSALRQPTVVGRVDRPVHRELTGKAQPTPKCRCQA